MTLTRADRSNRYLGLASTLCYLQCAFMALSAIALGVPAFAQGRANAFAMVSVLTAEAIAFGFAGRGLRKHLRSGAWIAVGVATVAIVSQLLLIGTLLNVWFVLNVATLTLIALGWSQLTAPQVRNGPPVA